MTHTITGKISINGESYVFSQSSGYWEGYMGRSFPKEYAWTQCNYENGSLMLSVADIPKGSLRFTGVIGVVLHNGNEYRIATYLGAKAMQIHDGEIIVRQGRMCLRVKRLEKSAHPLRAPLTGAMNRTIHENASCRVYYHFEESERTLLRLLPRMLPLNTNIRISQVPSAEPYRRKRGNNYLPLMREVDFY